MERKEKIIQKLIEEEVLEEKRLRKKGHYNWHWIGYPSTLVIIAAKEKYKWKSEAWTFGDLCILLVKKGDVFDESISFRRDNVYILQTIGEEDENLIELYVDIVADSKKWRLIDTPKYTLTYKKINRTQVFVFRN